MSDATNPVGAPVPNPAPSGQKANSPKSKRGRRLMIIIIVLLLLGLAGISALLLSFIAPRAGVAPKEDTNGITWVRSIYGWGDTPAQQLVVPQELTVDKNGDIWVTDTKYPDRALVFSPEGRLIRTVGDKAKEKLYGLGGLGIGFDDRLFLGETAKDRVRVFDQNSQELGNFSFPNPIDVATVDNKIIMGSTAGFAILNAEDGTPINIIGQRGKKDGEFDTVNGVAVTQDGRIFVADQYNNRLSAYNAEGERLWMVVTGAPGNKIDVRNGGAMAASTETTAPARLQLPSDVTIDGRGRVVVVDAMDFSISVFDPKDGKFIAKYGAYGPRDGQFIYPSSISYDPARDWFAVADSGNSRIQIVRIPDSSPNASPVAAARRALSGPLRACLIPLALLLAIIVFFVWRSRRNRKAEKAAPAPSPQATPES